MKNIFLVLLLCSLSIHAQELKKLPPIIDINAIDTSISPCDNFYQFACGNWIKNTKIPSNKTALFRQSADLTDNTDVILNNVILSFVNRSNKEPTHSSNQIAALYESCVNVDSHYDQNKSSLLSTLELTKSIKDNNSLALIVGKLHTLGVPAFFGFGAVPSYKNSKVNIAGAYQGGFALGEKDYYFNNDKKSKEIIKKYQEHMAHMFSLAGLDTQTAKKNASIAFKIEKALASNAYSMEQEADSTNLDHSIGLSGLKNLAPNFAWDIYFKALNAPELNELNVGELEFFKGFNSIITTFNHTDIAVYLNWQIINQGSRFVGKEFAAERFNFWSKFLNGYKESPPTWQKCTSSVENELGYALAEVYTKTIDVEKIKAAISAMVKNIENSFEQNLDTLSWIDPSTKELALKKLKFMQEKIGAPIKWKNYSELNLESDSFLSNIYRINMFETQNDLLKIGKNVDTDEWSMMPWEVNAYYDPSVNQFVLPFGILQPPSVDLNYSEGVNLGSFGGGTIGHELTHGFDTDGSQFDADGNLKNWWTEETKNQFNKNAQCFIEQASKYKIKEIDTFVDGDKTITENLADQGGVKLGYMALLNSLKNRNEANKWNNYNERQQFWIAYAQSWCSLFTKEALQEQIKTDYHPPSEFRVNGVMMNRPEFSKDFQCPKNSAMNPDQKCSLW